MLSFVRRSAFESGMDILEAMMKGNTVQTRIMYAVNMSHTPLKAHLCMMIERGMVKEIVNSKNDKRVRSRFELTEYGVEIVLAYRTLLKLWLDKQENTDKLP